MDKGQKATRALAKLLRDKSLHKSLPAKVRKQLEAAITPDRPAHRPPVTVWGRNLRAVNQTAIADVVFSFLSNTDHLARIEALLAASGLDAVDRQHYEEQRRHLRPLVPRKKEAVYTLAAEWFAARGITRTLAGGKKGGGKMTPEYIKREFIDLTKRTRRAGHPLKTPADWEALKARTK